MRVHVALGRLVGKPFLLSNESYEPVNATINAQRILKWEKSRRNTFPSDFIDAHILLSPLCSSPSDSQSMCTGFIGCLHGMARLKDSSEPSLTWPNNNNANNNNNYYDNACWRSQRIFSYLESKHKSFRIEFNFVAKFWLLQRLHNVFISPPHKEWTSVKSSLPEPIFLISRPLDKAQISPLSSYMLVDLFKFGRHLRYEYPSVVRK